MTVPSFYYFPTKDVPKRIHALSYEKEFHKVEFSRRARLPNGNIFHARECASPGELFV
jgi:hypothetical protein